MKRPKIIYRGPKLTPPTAKQREVMEQAVQEVHNSIKRGTARLLELKAQQANESKA